MAATLKYEVQTWIQDQGESKEHQPKSMDNVLKQDVSLEYALKFKGDKEKLGYQVVILCRESGKAASKIYYRTP